MAFTVVANDPLATGVGAHPGTDATGMGLFGSRVPGGAFNLKAPPCKRFFDEFSNPSSPTTGNFVAELGRGETDTDITYLALKNASGVTCYIYPDAAGTAITVSATKP